MDKKDILKVIKNNAIRYTEREDGSFILKSDGLFTFTFNGVQYSTWCNKVRLNFGIGLNSNKEISILSSNNNDIFVASLPLNEFGVYAYYKHDEP